MSAITVDGELVHYEVLGRGGRPVVLLHGWVGSWRYWIPTMRQLQLKFRVYALDLFGFGDSSKNPEKYPIDQQVEMLDQFMKELGLPKAAFLVHGLGTQIGVEYAHRFPDKVARMLIVSAPLFDPGGLEERLPPGKQVLLTVETAKKEAQDSKPDTRPSTVSADDPTLLTSDAPPADVTVPSSMRATIPSASSGAIDRDALRRAAEALKRQKEQESGQAIEQPEKPKEEEKPDTLTFPMPDKNGKNHLKDALSGDTMETLLNRCFKKSDAEYAKLHQDVSKGDSKVIDYTANNFDAGRMLDQIRTLTMPVVVVHGKQDPLIPSPREDIWDYLTEDKEDTMLPVALDGVRHFPMLEHETFQRLVGMFLELPDISKIELKERWRRRSR
jgi:pimeloyl-ACP methyl ester carboxylesterase